MSQTLVSPKVQLINMRTIYYTLTLFPLVYILLLVLIQEFALDADLTVESDPVFRTFLPVVFSVFAVIEIALAYMVFLPMFEKVEKFEQAFGTSLLPVILIEAIAIFGLFIGLLQGFADNGVIDWLFPLFLNGLSLLVNFNLVSRHIMPRMTILAEQAELASLTT